MSSLRKISKIFTPNRQPEGDGAEVRRIIGSHSLRNLDPFLMMDHFEVRKPNGFPDHPHRGFETVTYMLEGTCQHEDFKGHYGVIGPGDTQWMTAGRAIVHAEMPGTDRMEGLQLWINLRASDKMCAPHYQEKMSSELTKVAKDGIEVTIIAGESLGVRADTVTRTPTFYLDVKMQANKEFVQNVPDGWNCYIYVISGSVRTDSKEVKSNQAAVFETRGNICFTSDVNNRFVLLAGMPIGEKIVQYGPFVMNSDREIQEALRDYTAGVNGFEGARQWHSRIASGI